MNSEETLNRAKQARQLLEAPIFVEALTTVEQRLFAAWKSAANREDRDRVWAVARGLELVRRYLADAVMSGVLQEKRDEEARKLTDLERIHRIAHPEQYEE